MIEVANGDRNWVEITKKARSNLKEGNCTQDEFAVLLGVSVGNVRNWEQGQREPSQGTQTLLLLIKTYPDEVFKLLSNLEVEESN